MGRQEKTTMSVREMGELLGLKKVESYWLVHKEYFKTVLVNGKMRVVIESFEDWYAEQATYHKVNGELPGERLRQKSYSAKDIAKILQISEAYAYEVMEKAGIEPVLVEFRKRYPRDAFDAWYKGQSRFRNEEDRKRDREKEENSLSMPDMARLLDVPRSVIYGILKNDVDREKLEVIMIAGRKRITRESFDCWYAGQTKYLKPEDQPKDVVRKNRRYADDLMKKRRGNFTQRKPRQSANPEFLTVDEAAVLAGKTAAVICRWIREDRFPVQRISRKVTRIPKADFEAFLEKKNHA